MSLKINWRKATVPVAKMRSLMNQYTLLCLSIIWLVCAILFFRTTILQLLNLTEPNAIVPKKDLSQLRDLGLIVLGPFITLLTLHFTGQRANAMLKQAEAMTAGQITDLLSRAVKQIGDKNVIISTGGIKLLERVTLDNQDDVRAVVDILSTYIRKKTYGNKNNRPDEDIVAAVYALSRITKKYADYIHKEGIQPDLRRACLRGIEGDIEEIYFGGWNLTEIDFQGAYFYNADFQTAFLSGATFQRATFVAVIFKETLLEKTNFKDVEGLKPEQLKQAFYFEYPPKNLPQDIQGPQKREY